MLEKSHPTFFEMPAEEAGFNRMFGKLVGEARRGQKNEMILPENVLKFSHGKHWRHPASPHSIDGEMQTLSAQWNASNEEIIDGDLTLLVKGVYRIADQFYDAQMRLTFQTMSDVCEANGQTISTKEEGSNAKAFLAMLSKIEFAVDRDGNVSMPSVYMAPGAAEAFVAELDAQPQEYKDEVERIQAEKSTEALAREQARRDRFKRAPNG